ncbi:unnamed protein product [Arctogadus glacialis]
MADQPAAHFLFTLESQLITGIRLIINSPHQDRPYRRYAGMLPSRAERVHHCHLTITSLMSCALTFLLPVHTYTSRGTPRSSAVPQPGIVDLTSRVSLDRDLHSHLHSGHSADAFIQSDLQ